jgi:hypothetical protein
MNITQLIHDIIQHGYGVVFDDDFEGMLQVTFTDPNGKYVRHTHVGFPGATMAHLNSELEKFLALIVYKLETDGELEADSLAEKINA